jgi:glutamine amidotransferase
MIGVIDYNSGNIKSVCNALERIGQKFVVVRAPEEFEKCDKLIFPGVGAADFAMKSLKGAGFIGAICGFKKPFLGICLGMQLLAEFSEEGGVECLRILLNSRVLKFGTSSGTDDAGHVLKVPQVGWNRVNFTKTSAKSSLLFDGIESGEYFYFVNSYYLDCPDEYVLGRTDYGVNFVATVKKDNFYGVQFHPEKSGEAGQKLLLNFCEKC